MPYIHEEDRERLENGIPKTPGELNYLLTRVCQDYLDGRVGYGYFNDVIGAIEACKLEFYRRVVAIYEGKKIKENGDVY